jgi:hypothetical protein
MKNWALTVMPVLLAVSGCYSTYNVPVDALSQLNGYRADENRAVEDAAGHIHEFNQTRVLKLKLADGSHVDHKFSAIDVSDSMFTGLSQEGPIKIDLSQVRTARLREPSVSKVVGLGLGIGIPLLMIGAGVGALGFAAIRLNHS